MNDRTGEIHERRKGESMTEMAHRPNVPRRYLVPLGKAPDPDCYRCHGRGSVPKGLRSKRFKPCKCTYTEEGTHRVEPIELTSRRNETSHQSTHAAQRRATVQPQENHNGRLSTVCSPESIIRRTADQ